MSINYTTYVSQLTTLMSVASSTDSNFSAILPGCIDYAEQRMYRELDLLATRITDSSTTTANGRSLIFPTNFGSFLVVEQIDVITSSNNTRNPLTFVSRDFLDTVYPSNSIANGVPQFAAIIDNTQAIMGPVPDAAYSVLVAGTQRPTPLSSGNSSTILTQMLPDVFMAASMVYMSGFMRDFGAQSDNPQMAQSWEQQYKTLFASAGVEEFRKKYQSAGWSNQMPSPPATPPRV